MTLYLLPDNSTKREETEKKNVFITSAPIAKHTWAKNIAPLVSVSCITYNQESFIQDALEGFLMQQTTFPVEILIYDDASTDTTTQIIREYEKKFPQLIFAIYQKQNQYSQGKQISTTYQFPRARGKYIALCEGDDYWTDPLKLQEQVEFLEKNPGYIAIAENGVVNNSITNQIYLFSDEPERDLTIEEMVVKRRFPTASVMFRSTIIPDFLKDAKQANDTILWCYLASKGKFKYRKKVSSVYNRGLQGVVESTGKIQWAQTVEKWKLELIRLFAKKYFNKQIAYHNIWEHYWIVYANKYYENYYGILYVLFKCLKYNAPLTFKEFIKLATPSIKTSGIQIAKLIIRNPAILNNLKTKYSNLIKQNKIQTQQEKHPSFYKIPHSVGINTIEKKHPSVIVSLTSFPERIKTSHLAIHTLLRQTCKPDKVVLWLAESQFPAKEQDLPDNLLQLQKYGLTIDWCEDIKSYKKLIPTLKKYPKDIIITVDDDIYYPPTLLERLYTSYTSDKKSIHCQRGRKILFDKEHTIIPYNNWVISSYGIKASYLNMILGAGGVLYPPGSLHSDVLNNDLFMNLSPTGDDIWFWAMAVINKTRIKIMTDNFCFLETISTTQENSLWENHNKNGSNDLHFRNILKHYPNIKLMLQTEYQNTSKTEFPIAENIFFKQSC